MIKIENIKYWIWLSLLKGIGSRKCLTLLEKYQTPEKIFFDPGRPAACGGRRQSDHRGGTDPRRGGRVRLI